ncbi:MAG TPA: MEDS domain-containing protein [Vicinamibacterales bacterium]|nr:MEDS domain-containing protein [Vicinamibacterales bacterium]
MTQDSAAQVNQAQHMVELFESTETLVDTVSGFLSDGLTQGDDALVVMRLAQWNSVASKLTSRNVSLSNTIATGRLTVLDGTRTLARIMLHGAPCRGLFEEVIGKTVRQICASGIRVRVYADLVDVLAADGNFHGAHELEKMWSDLTTQEQVTVLCGYSAATFYGPDADDTLKSICRSHTDIRSSRLPMLTMPAARLD